MSGNHGSQNPKDNSLGFLVLKIMADDLTPQQQIEKLLSSMPQLLASDLHLKVGLVPYFRIQRVLRAAKMPPIPDSAFVEAMLHDLIPKEKLAELEKVGAVDFAASTESGDRFRINMYRAMGHTNASIRRVQGTPPSFEELHLPEVYGELLSKTIDGLILVSGATGTGKSSTMAAMLDYINENRSLHIITIEDPIEFVFRPKKSIVSQREIGIDVADYPTALRDVVRQDPDCIMIGELRDKETMLAAIQAAETGHLVLGSLHVSDVHQTFSRILEFFPRSEHAFIRSSLSSSIRGVLCQRLVPGIDEGSLFPATEVLLKTPSVRDLIFREKDEELPMLMERSRREGMRTFTQSLCELIESERVHYDTAMEYATNREALSSLVKGIKTLLD